ncbi:ribosome-associated heat shock protein implicated in recycling of 50S subunit [Thiovulum sp. ES]|nr:ribosome-associated heat shock protein implicated in recycling of 50S subunit [Thiovulum sp. ES]
MRIDKFLNSVNITKRRAVAQDMLKNGVVFLNKTVAKQSKDVKIGDIIEIKYLNGDSQKWKILEIPKLKTTPKNEQDKYVSIC